MVFSIFSSLLVIFILVLFFSLSKSADSETLSSSIFECGFSSYYFSRFSFSMHYFAVGLVFLFMDLELSFLLPFFNSDFCEFKMISLLVIFILVLVLGVLEEWKHGILDWKS